MNAFSVPVTEVKASFHCKALINKMPHKNVQPTLILTFNDKNRTSKL